MEKFSERNIKPSSIGHSKYKIFTVVLGVYHPGWLHFMVRRFGNGYDPSRIGNSSWSANLLHLFRCKQKLPARMPSCCRFGRGSDPVLSLDENLAPFKVIKLRAMNLKQQTLRLT